MYDLPARVLPPREYEPVRGVRHRDRTQYCLGPAIILTLVLMMVVVAWCVKDRAIAWTKVPANARILGERLLHEPYDYTVYGAL